MSRWVRCLTVTRSWKTALVAGFVLFAACTAARAGVFAPPNDYTGFLFRGRHYLRVIPRNTWEFAVVVSCLALLPACSTASWLRSRRFPDSGGRSARRANVLAVCSMALELLWGLAAGWEFVRTHPWNYAWTPHWPRVHYIDTPKHRSEYDQFCIDWYNAHQGGGTGRPPFGVPVMRKGAPEAVTNAYEAFRESLRSERDMRHGRDMRNVGESIAGGEWE